MTSILVVLLILIVLAAAALWLLLRSRNLHIWIVDYLRPAGAAGGRRPDPCHVQLRRPLRADVGQGRRGHAGPRASIAGAATIAPWHRVIAMPTAWCRSTASSIPKRNTSKNT